MLSSVVTTQGQVTIPAELRENLGIKPGDRVGFVEERGRLILQPHPQGVATAFGILKSKKAASLKKINEAISGKWKRRARP